MTGLVFDEDLNLLLTEVPLALERMPPTLELLDLRWHRKHELHVTMVNGPGLAGRVGSVRGYGFEVREKPTCKLLTQDHRDWDPEFFSELVARLREPGASRAAVLSNTAAETGAHQRWAS